MLGTEMSEHSLMTHLDFAHRPSFLSEFRGMGMLEDSSSGSSKCSGTGLALSFAHGQGIPAKPKAFLGKTLFYSLVYELSASLEKAVGSCFPQVTTRQVSSFAYCMTCAFQLLSSQ